jgi:GNAT superfamily N-acetyltransferase
MQTILHIETLALHAWPAAEVVALDGWRLRADGGVTRRANSVWPNGAEGALELPAKIAAAEAFYTARNLPTIYQISPAQQPPELDDELADRGYRDDARTWVQTSSLAAMRANLPEPHAQGAVTLSTTYADDWFDLYCASEGVTGHAADVRRRILARITAATGYALLHLDGLPVAVGMGVVEAGWLGIYCMATLPTHRRRGLARQVLAALAAWAQTEGAQQAYLQVMVYNTPAQALYAGAGFATAYQYHYRIREHP